MKLLIISCLLFASALAQTGDCPPENPFAEESLVQISQITAPLLPDLHMSNTAALTPGLWSTIAFRECTPSPDPKYCRVNYNATKKDDGNFLLELVDPNQDLNDKNQLRWVHRMCTTPGCGVNYYASQDYRTNKLYPWTMIERKMSGFRFYMLKDPYSGHCLHTIWLKTTILDKYHLLPLMMAWAKSDIWGLTAEGPSISEIGYQAISMYTGAFYKDPSELSTDLFGCIKHILHSEWDQIDIEACMDDIRDVLQFLGVLGANDGASFNLVNCPAEYASDVDTIPFAFSVEFTGESVLCSLENAMKKTLDDTYKYMPQWVQEIIDTAPVELLSNNTRSMV